MDNSHSTGKKLSTGKLLLMVYPFFLGWYPIFALRNHNINYVDLATTIRTLMIVTFGLTFIHLLTGVVIRDLEKQSVITGLIAILSLSYGHIYIQLGEYLGEPIHHRYLAGAYILVFLCMTLLALRNGQIAKNLAKFLAITSLVLIFMATYETLSYDIKLFRAMNAAKKLSTTNDLTLKKETLPDFYMIILDAHTRSDVLKARYGYDNAAFTQQLAEMGFFVAECSQSNYASTKLSLVSATFGDYIRTIVPEGETVPPLESSPVNQILKSLGYKTIAFENRASGHFDLDEDLHLARNQAAFGKFDIIGGFNEFERMMVDTSFMRFVFDTEIIPGFNDLRLRDWEYKEHYYQTNYILSELEKIPDISGPKFVFTHIMVPHSPFIFNPDGTYQHTTNSISGYRSNVEFIDNRLPVILQTIIEKSDPQPIIIVMGDHGPATNKKVTREMRMATLNAYLVNERAKTQMYTSLTPVNAMRIILNAHFNTTYELLADVSYYAYGLDQIHDSKIIQNDCLPSK